MLPYKIIAADLETDKFQHGVWIKPFLGGFYDGNKIYRWWNPNCMDLMFDFLTAEYDPSLIYIHNGGKFDLHFGLHRLDGIPHIIDARIVEVKMAQHTIRDSYSILPVALAKFGGKKSIAYWKMDAPYRDDPAIKKEIIEYWEADCISLYDTVYKFCEEFSPEKLPKKTIAATSISEFNQLYEYERMEPGQDRYMRDYYYGGRCQCFDKGILYGDWNVYDINGMYADQMRNVQHPISNIVYTGGGKITSNTAFLSVIATNNGAFAFREKDKSLNFDRKFGLFHISIHEYNAAIETGTAIIHRIVKTINFEKFSTFEKFIDKFYGKREIAKKSGDVVLSEMYKLISNSSYGKFSQDPQKFKKYDIEHGPKRINPLVWDKKLKEMVPQWSLEVIRLPKRNEEGKIIVRPFIIYSKPAPGLNQGYYNVATGASITGSARASLLRGMQKAKRLVYSDTDSIIAESLDIDADPTKLGAWKHENVDKETGKAIPCQVMVIAGKKIYCLLTRDKAFIKKKIKEVQSDPNGDPRYHFAELDGEIYAVVKIAHKGARLMPSEIIDLARGKTVEYASPAPTFRVFGKSIFQKRTIRATA